ncbi:hypothetical protein EX895_003795 [Sporisorium graminicola]|uniref:Uncharacterized protein n=1 Tax=Sporisorium graminicola TaxID=280036 RepID=A0A4U7KUU6_9BASI|nr:hypothetical protein EX895_003795 [Sporisorium graminicola]TKY87118.1 hypothetical protein EX895_003795 [Sporisorium graminicola]
MLASSHTISRVETTPSHSTASTSQLLLRGTRDGDLVAALSSSSSSSSPTASERAPLFTWGELSEIVSSGQLHKLARHPDDLKEYFAWMTSVKESYGSVTNFLLSERFTATRLLEKASSSSSFAQPQDTEVRCFRSDFVPGLDCQILVNDWPYSVPRDVTHYVVWSHLPILHPDLVAHARPQTAQRAWSIIAKRGLCATLSPTASPRAAFPPLDNLTSTSDLVEQEQVDLHNTLRSACAPLIEFIACHWNTARSEVAFFANPPSLQSVPSLAHFHVLVKPLL